MATLDSPERLSVFQGQAIASGNDPVLQAIVDEAAELAQTPIAAVTLVMGAIQYFRASHGLPAELEVSRATSRSDSFCQFVVKDEQPFIVESASEDARVPKHLVETYGIESYVGVPLTMSGQQAGSLCVIDVEGRQFPEDLTAQLEQLAARASVRLDELSKEDGQADAPPPPASLTASAEELAFQARLLERALAELSPLVRIGEALSTAQLSAEDAARAASVLTEAAPVFQLLIDESQRMRIMSAKHAERIEHSEADAAS